MIVGRTSTVVVAARLLSTGGVPINLGGGTAPTTVVIQKLECEVEARLLGNDFKIGPAGWETKSFLQNSSLKWSWQTTPLKSGQLTLQVDLQGLVRVPGVGDVPAGTEFNHQEPIAVNAVPRTLPARLNRGIIDIATYPVVIVLASTGGLAVIGRWLAKRFRRPASTSTPVK